MLRVHNMAQWFTLSDQTMEEALHDTPVLRAGTAIEATLIAAPSSTKNASGKRAPTRTRARRATRGTSA